MSYNASKQFRCDIVRTRAVSKIDDLLPIYAKIIHDVCPCSESDFVDSFNFELKNYLLSIGNSVDKKALNNHRTETAKTLFGMYYVDQMGIVHESERTEKYLKDGDQPAFFKDFCYKLQFPSGMTKQQKLEERISKGVSIYPYRFLLAVLQKALKEGVTLNIRELGYYVLNSEDVLCGLSTPDEVIKAIKDDQKAGAHHDIDTGKNKPWDWEHIEGMINYLTLANLVTVNGKKRMGHERNVTINSLEASAVKIFVDGVDEALKFDVLSYDRSTIKKRKEFQLAWDKYNASLSDKYSSFYTMPSALGISLRMLPTKTSKKAAHTIAIGKIGESYVYNYEIERVKKIDPTYCSLIKDRSAERGIGFDIESIVGDGSAPMTPKYIEVKTTTRVTAPSVKNFIDSINITRNEWKAAQTFKDAFFIYRVYITKGKVFIFVIGSIMEKETLSLLEVSAPVYEVRFDVAKSGVVDEKISI